MPMDDFPRIKVEDLREEFTNVFDTGRYFDVGIGWLGLIREFVKEALPYNPALVIHECKEKWGRLRIWCDTPVLEARLAKGKAEFKSSLTCEVCGAPGLLRRPPLGKYAWWRTLCDEHASEDQRSWGTRSAGPYYGHMQVRNDWYRYDAETDSMVPSEPPARWR